MFLVEFAIAGTQELSSEMLLYAQSAEQARKFASDYASNWGMEVFAVTPITEQQVVNSRLQHRSFFLSDDDT
jgi:hypothetical protein